MRLRLVPAKTNVGFMAHRVKAFVLSGVLFAASVGLFLAADLNYGIDFEGGILIEVGAPGPADLGRMRGALSGLGLGEVHAAGGPGRPAEIDPGARAVRAGDGARLHADEERGGRGHVRRALRHQSRPLLELGGGVRRVAPVEHQVRGLMRAEEEVVADGDDRGRVRDALGGERDAPADERLMDLPGGGALGRRVRRERADGQPLRHAPRLRAGADHQPPAGAHVVRHRAVPRGLAVRRAFRGRFGLGEEDPRHAPQGGVSREAGGQGGVVGDVEGHSSAPRCGAGG